ncbi:Fantastic Four meristem regulator [Carex littledalei]|uniref:Fantastic Four meristem regulator n=1 Tax=Carex littledalei TaxID=544730 RepID=A0A833VB96_9POAL|nr:Fantastic Four meristem regulator [Carex littledalei]
MASLGQILEVEVSSPVKKSRLTIALPPWREFMPPKPKPENTVLEIFGEMEFRERNSGITTPSPSPIFTPIRTPLLYSPDLSQFDNEEIQIQEVEEPSPEKIEPCQRETCLRCNSVVGLRVLGAEFPAPISSIGRNGKPRVYYQPIKKDGRLVLKEIRIPGKQCMHASRENGRLLLQLGNFNSSHG